jgi:hypothetical protein
MEHLEGHPHAFLRNDTVINVAVFDGHDSELLNVFKEAHNADWVMCCCDHGPAFIGGLWDGTRFYPAKPYSNWIWYEGSGVFNSNGIETFSPQWVPPIPRPTDALYEWNQQDYSWGFVRDFDEDE